MAIDDLTKDSVIEGIKKQFRDAEREAYSQLERNINDSTRATAETAYGSESSNEEERERYKELEDRTINEYIKIFRDRGIEFTEGYLAGGDPERMSFSNELKEIIYKLASKVMGYGEGEDWIYKAAQEAHENLSFSNKTPNDVKETFQHELYTANERAIKKYDFRNESENEEDFEDEAFLSIDHYRIDEFTDLFLRRGKDFTLGYMAASEGKISNFFSSVYRAAEIAFKRYQEE